MIMALARCWSKLTKAASMSRSLPAFRIRRSTPSELTATRTSAIWDSDVGFVGLTRKPTTAALGTSSRSSSKRFAPRVLMKKVTPVTSPPGRLRLDTRPDQPDQHDRKYDRNGCGCSLGGQRSRRADHNDRGRGVGHQLGSQCRQSVKATIGRAILDCDITAFDVAGVPKTLSNSPDLSIIELDA